MHADLHPSLRPRARLRRRRGRAHPVLAGPGRRRGLRGGGDGLARAARQTAKRESYGLSAFGELALPADFPHLPYADPAAPKGGIIVLEPTTAGLNQNFTTFDTLNIYILRGDGAAGLGLIFDSLMAGTLDEPDAAYGIVARSVRWSADRLTYRFLLRPEARFHDGSRLTAADAAFTMDLLKTKGHPNLRTGLRHLASATALADDLLEVKLDPARTRETHLTVAGLPIFSKAYYTAHPFDQTTLDPPLGSSAYRVGAVGPGAHHHVRACQGLLGQGPPDQPRPGEFRRGPLRILPRTAGRLRGVSSRGPRPFTRISPPSTGPRATTSRLSRTVGSSAT